MKKAIFLAIGILFVASTIASATCWTPTGDRAFRYGFGNPGAFPEGYTPPPGVYNVLGVFGPDSTEGIPGQVLEYWLAPYNATAWLPGLCVAEDTICFDAYSTHGWTMTGDPKIGDPQVLPPGGYLWYQQLLVKISCDAEIGSYETVVAVAAYSNTDIECDISCADCADPNIRPTGRHAFYSSDTLYVHVLPAPPPPAPTILQDSLFPVEQGQTQAYVPFSLCNGDQCFAYNIEYNIQSTGHFGGTTNWHGTVSVAGGKCVDVFAIINAGSLTPCQLDTLTAICWTVVETPLYDTCVQIVHIVEPSLVPLFTVPVLTILVLALILAAAVFMRRRAVSKA